MVDDPHYSFQLAHGHAGAHQSLTRKLLEPYDCRRGDGEPGALSEMADDGLANDSKSSGVNSKVGTKDELREDGEVET